ARTGRLLAIRPGQAFQAGDAVFDAAFAVLVRAVELDAVVEHQARHLEGGLLALALGVGIEEAAAVVDARMVGGQRLGALWNGEAGEALGHLANQHIDRLRRLDVVAEEEQRVERRVARLGVLHGGARDRGREHRAGRQRDTLALGLAEARLAAAVVVDRGLAYPLRGDAAVGGGAMIELQLPAVAALGHLRLL